MQTKITDEDLIQLEQALSVTSLIDVRICWFLASKGLR